MKLKRTALAAALTLGLVAGANATTYNYGTLTAPNLYYGSHIINGTGVSFTDYYTFNINTPLTSGGAVNNVAQYTFYDITNLGVKLYAGLVGSGTLVYDLATNPNSTPNYMTGSGTYAVGDYYYEVKGLTTGSVGGNYTFTANTLPVPEPETYAMLMVGLGLIGTIVRRRRNKSA